MAEEWRVVRGPGEAVICAGKDFPVTYEYQPKNGELKCGIADGEYQLSLIAKRAFINDQASVLRMRTASVAVHA